MSDRLEAETGDAEPSALDYDAFGLDPDEQRDALVMRAVAKVMMLHRRCVKLCDEQTPRDEAFAIAEEQRRAALVDLAEIAAVTPAAYAAKRDVLMQMIPWFGREDSDLFDCFVKLSNEAVSLMAALEETKLAMARPSQRPTGNGRVRWLFGIAAAVPGLLQGRWDSGGLG